MSVRLQRYRNNPILKPIPSHRWEGAQVFNPSVLYEKGFFRMLYRAVASGWRPFAGGYSSIGYAQSRDGIHWKRNVKPLIRPEHPYEEWGCEDPRVTKLGDTYYIFYTAISKTKKGKHARPRIALATTKDFKRIKKYGVVGPDIRSKAGTIFPEKINDKVMMLLAAFSDSPASSIIYTFFDNEKKLLRPPKSHWTNLKKYYRRRALLSAPLNYERGAETGAPPIRTEKGWLLIYCGPAKKKPVWPIHAALLDLKDPTKVINYTKQPILKPERKEEVAGRRVRNVTFPEGAVIVGKKLYVYYGAGDNYIFLATCNLDKLLRALNK